MATRERGGAAVVAPDDRVAAVTTLLDLLERCESGRAFVDECLAAAVRTWDLTAAAIVLFDDELGRVVVVHDGHASPELQELIDAQHEPALVTLPSLPPDPIPWALTHTASIALTLDRNGWDPTVDPDTGLFSVDAFRRLVVLNAERHRFGEHPFSILAVEVDDHREEIADDRVQDVAARTAAAMAATMRRIDAAARVGPTRFAVLLDGADRADARAFLGRVRSHLAADPVLTTVDYQVGVASCPEDDLDIAALVRTARLRLSDGEVVMERLPAAAGALEAPFDTSWLRDDAPVARELTLRASPLGPRHRHRAPTRRTGDEVTSPEVDDSLSELGAAPVLTAVATGPDDRAAMAAGATAPATGASSSTSLQAVHADTSPDEPPRPSPARSVGRPVLAARDRHRRRRRRIG